MYDWVVRCVGSDLFLVFQIMVRSHDSRRHLFTFTHPRRYFDIRWFRFWCTSTKIVGATRIVNLQARCFTFIRCQALACTSLFKPIFISLAHTYARAHTRGVEACFTILSSYHSQASHFPLTCRIICDVGTHTLSLSLSYILPFYLMRPRVCANHLWQEWQEDNR